MTLRLLVVEDEPDIQELLMVRLKMKGYEVATASDGRQGYLGLQQFKPHLVVCDVVMPIEDGLSFCRRVRAEGNKIPFLFLTARGQPQDIVEVLSAGGDDYVIKPFNPAELLARIQSILRRFYPDPIV